MRTPSASSQTAIGALRQIRRGTVLGWHGAIAELRKQDARR
jgi:hypothetical protein